jgi:hypothetical protein
MDQVLAPRELLEQIVDMKVDPGMDARAQYLMDRNNFGQLSEDERAELAGYVAFNQRMTIARGLAMVALGRKLG